MSSPNGRSELCIRGFRALLTFEKSITDRGERRYAAAEAAVVGQNHPIAPLDTGGTQLEARQPMDRRMAVWSRRAPERWSTKFAGDPLRRRDAQEGGRFLLAGGGWQYRPLRQREVDPLIGITHNIREAIAAAAVRRLQTDQPTRNMVRDRQVLGATTQQLQLDLSRDGCVIRSH